MSSGAKVKIYACEEITPGVTPVSPTWYAIRRISDGLDEDVSTETGESIKDTVFRSGGSVTESNVVGDLQTELSVLLFDWFWSALAMNDWVSDVLSFGGDVHKTFTFVKVFSDTNQVFIYRGIRINQGTLSIATTGKIKAGFGLVGMSFERTTVNPVTSPIDDSENAIIVSMPNVKDVLVNGVGVVGTACLQSVELTITNNLEAYRCIGSETSSPQGYNRKMTDITLATSFMFSNQSATYIDYVKSRATMPLSFGIEDSAGNSYMFDFPKLEVGSAPHPNGGGEDTLTLDVSFNHIDVTPTITRTVA